MPKLRELLASRRLWAALAVSIAAVVMHGLGLIDAERMATMMEWAGLGYGGAVGLEHAARSFEPGVSRSERPTDPAIR